MKLCNLFEDNSGINELPKGYGTEKDDQSSLKLSDVRKTRLTLGQLNKLRILNDVRSLEHEQKIKKVAKMYKPSEQGGGGMM